MVTLTKKQKLLAIMLSSLVLMAATIPLAIWLTHTSSAQLENSRRRCEGKKATTHIVNISHGKVVPAHVDAVLCDRLTITNLDERPRLIAFGQHDKHISYNGVSERLLAHNKSFTVTLGHSGSYLFHDHEDESVEGTFSVATPKS